MKILFPILTSVSTTIGWVVNNFIEIFERDNGLMSKEAIELLSNPNTREDFINFTSGNDESADSSNIENQSRSKTFELKNGEKITIVTYS